MIKVVTIFLIVILILGLFGRLKFPHLPKSRKRNRIADARKCKTCGSYIIGEGPCPCGK